MSKEIDERVVEMRFDNKQFEKNVATTMNTVDKLKEKLKFSNSSSGFEKLQNAASKVSFNSMTKSIDTVKVKLSSLQVAGMTVISNITNTLLSTAKKFTSTIPTLISEGGKARALNIEQAKFQFKGLGMPCSPASIAYAGKELMALRIKNLGTIAQFLFPVSFISFPHF